MPKYFVSAAAVARIAETASNHHLWCSSPAIQHSIDQSQSASSMRSHIILVAETRNAGVKSVSSAAISGSRQNRREIANVAKIDRIGQMRNARCMASSLQPTSDAAAAM